MINSFDNKYSFLSNFYLSPMEIDFGDGSIIICPSVEHAFQAAKTKDLTKRMEILTASTPGHAKRLGRKVYLREDWEDIKDGMMERFVHKKFQNPELRVLLLNTKDEDLEEGNWWHDNYWGNCYCERCQNIKGKNMLGQILMKERESIQREESL